MRRGRAAGAAVLSTALAGGLLLAVLSYGAGYFAFLANCDENAASAPGGACTWLDEGGSWQLPALAALVAGGGAILADRLRSARVAWLAIGLALFVGVVLPWAIAS